MSFYITVYTWDNDNIQTHSSLEKGDSNTTFTTEGEESVCLLIVGQWLCKIKLDVLG